MHESSYLIVERFEKQHARKLPEVGGLQKRVLDVGSYDVNGTYRPIFDRREPPSGAPAYLYTGIDIVKGPNVDRVVEPYDFGSTTYDVVISGSCMEHVQDIFAWARAVMNSCRRGGLVCVTAPHTWEEHRHPVDCWRIFPDGMRFAFRELEVLECDRNNCETWIYARKP